MNKLSDPIKCSFTQTVGIVEFEVCSAYSSSFYFLWYVVSVWLENALQLTKVSLSLTLYNIVLARMKIYNVPTCPT